MSLNIYFLDNDVEDVEQQVCLNITHNMNKVVDGCGTFEGLVCFLCDYLKECYRNKDSFVYCCR